MKIISIKEWEKGLKIPEDLFQPVYGYRNILLYFIGRETGVIVSREFSDVLELYC